MLRRPADENVSAAPLPHGGGPVFDVRTPAEGGSTPTLNGIWNIFGPLRKSVDGRTTKH
jgi:hypothetical protein